MFNVCLSRCICHANVTMWMSRLRYPSHETQHDADLRTNLTPSGWAVFPFWCGQPSFFFFTSHLHFPRFYRLPSTIIILKDLGNGRANKVSLFESPPFISILSITRYIYIQVNWSPYNSPEPETLYPHGCLAFCIQTSYVPQTAQAMRSQQVAVSIWDRSRSNTSSSHPLLCFL